MGCNGSPQVMQINSPQVVNFADVRRGICAACEHAKNGICEIVEARHPGKALIEDGIQRHGVRCPLPEPEWIEEPQKCPNCKRPHQVVPIAKGVCKWCQIKQQIYGPKLPLARQRPPIKPNQFSGQPVLHLHYFLYPRYRESTRYHLDRLRKSIGQFNGRRVVCVATDADTNEREIEGELRELFTSIDYQPNNPARRELVGFIPSLEKLETTNNDEVICFAHSKGQQIHSCDSETVRKWTDACYETVVENWDAVRDAMERGYSLAGAFKSLASFRSTDYRWHYSGTFFWARSAAIFANQNWRQTCNRWWGSESYVARHFSAEEGYCTFADNAPFGAGYSLDQWHDRFDKELEAWRSNRLTVGAKT